MTYKNIRIKKKGGGSRLQRVQVLKSGKYKFVKNPRSRSRSVTKTRRKRRKNPVSTRRRYTIRRYRRRRSQSTTIPLAVVGGTIAAFSPEIQSMAAGDWTGAANSLAASFSTIQGGIQKVIPIIVGVLIHIACSKLGVNRALGRARIPFIRV